MLRHSLPWLLEALARQSGLPAQHVQRALASPSLGSGAARWFQTAADLVGPAQQAAARSAIPLRTGRPRLVVLGTGWGGARLVRDIDPAKYDITVRTAPDPLNNPPAGGGLGTGLPPQHPCQGSALCCPADRSPAPQEHVNPSQGGDLGAHVPSAVRSLASPPCCPAPAALHLAN
jgi:hypothetical protein